MTDLSDIQLQDLVPASIANDPQIQAMSAELQTELDAINAAIPSIELYSRIDELPEPILRMLAWENRVYQYEWALATTIEAKRELVRNSFDLNQRRGTRWSVERVLEITNVLATLQEWFEYGGDPYHFKISLIDVDGQPPTPEQIDLINKLVNKYKPLRSVLEAIDGILTGDQVNAYAGVANTQIAVMDNYAEGKRYNAENYMPSPFDPEGWSGAGDTDGSITNVTIANPTGSTVVAEVESLTGGQFNINNALSAGSVTVEQKLYVCVVTKPLGAYETGIRFRFSDTLGFAGDTVLSGTDGRRLSGGTLNTSISTLSNDYILIQIEFIVQRDVNDIFCQMLMWSNDNSGNAPAGSKLYVQAAFFGKNPLEFPYAFYDEFVDKTAGKISYLETNYMPSPFDPEGWSGAGDTDGSITNVTIANPTGSTVVAEVESLPGGQFNINNALSAGSVTVEQKLYVCVVTKPLGAYETGIRFRFSDTIGFAGDTVLSGTDGRRLSGGTLNTSISTLSNDYILIQIEFIVQRDVNDIFCQMLMWSNDNSGNAPAGSKLYMQAAYFGKADDWPARFNNTTNWDSMSANLNVDNGILSFKAANNEPQMESNVDFDGSKYTNVIVRWKRNSGLTNNVMYWGNDQGGFAAERAISFEETTTAANVTTETSGDFFISTIDMSGDPKWTDQGNVQGIRFDFGNSLASDFDIDYIKIYDQDLFEQYEAWWPELVDYYE